VTNAGKEIVPHYWTVNLHEDICLYEGPFDVLRGDDKEALHGHVIFSWLPRPAVSFDGISHELQGISHLFDPKIEMDRSISIPDLEEIPSRVTPSIDLDTSGYAVRSSGDLHDLRE
jgi:hypothetical protein